MSPRSVMRFVVGALFGVALAAALVLYAGSPQGSQAAPGTLTGVVVEEHGDDFEAGVARPYLTLVTDHDRFSLTGPGAAWVKPGQRIRVQAVQRGGILELAGPISIQVLAQFATPPPDPLAAQDGGSLDGLWSDGLSSDGSLTTSSETTSTSTINRRVAVLLVNFLSPTPTPAPTPTPCVDPPTPEPTPTPDPLATPGATPSPTATPCPAPTPTPTAAPTPTPPPQPWTRSQVAGFYFNNTKSVKSFFNEMSNGRLAISGDVFGWYTLTINLSTCDYNGIATAARAAATANGVNLSNYTNYAYAFPRVSSCSWGGLGSVNGPHSWINGTSAMGVYVPAHELGHNFGAHHANALTCTSGGVRVQFSNNCTSAEYADPFDLMGSNASSSNGIRHMHTWHRKQIGVLSTADWQTVTASGTYTVATAQVDGGVPRILRVKRPVSGLYYTMEFRQPYGIFDDYSSSAPVVNGVTIRIAPSTNRVQSQLIDANPSTSSFADAALGVGQTFVDKINDITIITRSISSTAAKVYIQIGPDVTPPTAPGTLSASLATSTSVSLSWGAAFDEIGVTGYRVSRDGVLLGTVSGLTFTDNNVPQGGTRRYSVAARDAAGNVGPPVTRDIVVPDTIAPSAPGPVSAVATGPGEVSLSWTAATDNVGVTGYRVSRNGTLLATVSGLTYTAKNLIGGTSYTFSVAARDAAGNVGTSVSTTLVMPDVVPPSAPGAAWVSAFDGTTLTISWGPATDDVGVAGYRVTRDGVLAGTTTQTSYTDSAVNGGTVYQYGVAAFDAAGNVGQQVTVNVDPMTGSSDTTPPTVGAPRTVLLAGRQAESVKVPVHVSWTATDPSGITSIQVQQSKNGGSWTNIKMPSATASSVTLMRPPGNSFRFRVRATDGAGNTSAWVAGPTFKVVARQEKNTNIKYAGTWTSASLTSAYGGALRHAKSSTATATLTFTGSSIAWMTSRGSNRGVADVFIDGVRVATIDLYAAATQMRQVVFSHSWDTVATRTIQIRVKGTSGRPRVDLDAFLFLR